MKVVPIVPEDLGNTITKSKQVVPSKRWCFTLNNYTEEESSSINEVFRSCANLFVIGIEIGESGTPHLQGYVEFTNKLRPLSLKLSNRIHYEKCRGTRDENIAYCTKDNNVLFSYGLPKKINVITELLPWQRETVDMISGEPDERKIHWYYDYRGGSGKSALVKLLCYSYKALVCSGRGADMKYMIVKYFEKNGVYPDVVIFDIPRSMKDYVSYAGMEEIKNGCFASSKYECDMVIMNAPHMLCFANDLPEMEKLSRDRWVFHDLNPVGDDPE